MRSNIRIVRCFKCLIEFDAIMNGQDPHCPQCGRVPYLSFHEAFPTFKDKLEYYRKDLLGEIDWGHLWKYYDD